MSATQTEERTTAEYLQSALDDLNEARRAAAEEMRSVIDSAIARSRDALDHLRVDAEDRAEHVKEIADSRVSEWQETLDDASEDLRRELGVRGIRAQHSKDALEVMSDEIKHQKKELKATH